MEQQALHTVIPEATFRDTLAVLVLLLSLPPFLSALALGIYVFFIVSVGTHTLTAALSRMLRGPSGECDYDLTPSLSSTKEKEKEKEKEEKQSTSSPLILIALFDLFVCAVLHFTGPWMTRGIFVLSKSLVAGSLSGDRVMRVFLAVGVVACAELVFSTSVGYLDTHMGIRISNGFQLFPHALLHYNYNHNYGLYYNYGSHYLVIAVNMANLLLAVHVVLVAFASVFRKNFLSKSLNQLSATNELPPTFNHLRVRDHTQTEPRVVQVELSQEQADTQLIIEPELTEHLQNVQAPAAYIQDTVITADPASTENIVARNFEVFCATSAIRTKHRQPVWSLFAAVRAMATRKDIYSGETSNSDSNNALILSDYVNHYDDYLFANFDETGLHKERIHIFIDYIGETLISFQLQNYQKGDIIVRVNGVIWYQVSRGAHGGDIYFIVGGLTPLSQYDIQFIIEEEDHTGNKRKHLLDDLIVSTVGNKGESVAASHSTSNNTKVLSPLVTLQESLITTNDNLAKERLKLKKQRKEISKKLSSYKTEIEQLKNKISSSDKHDEKNWKKVLSLRMSVKQAEEDVAKVERDSAEVEAQENEVAEVHMVEKRRFDQTARTYQQQKNAYLTKIDVKRSKLSELNVELDSLQAKSEKLKAKLVKLEKEVEKSAAEIEELCASDLKTRLVLREKRAEKRKALLGEFRDAIERVEAACEKLREEIDLVKKAAGQ